MSFTLSKTDYLLFRECPNNAWYKIHKPEIYGQSELSEFDKSIMETGSEVELLARKLFPGGILVEGRDSKAQEITQEHLLNKLEVIFQPIFVKDGYLAATDVLKLDPETMAYSIYEVKSTNSIDEKSHYHDLTFQVNLLRKYGLTINKAYIVHLNSEYVRSGELDLVGLFKVVDVTNEVEGLVEGVATEMKEAIEYLSKDTELAGSCCCIYKGRSRHCTTFQYSNPMVPEYSVHDIARIGNSKAKLKELVDNNIFDLDKIPSHIKLSDIQQNQVDTYSRDTIIINKDMIREELSRQIFPLYFLDYETFPSAVPRFDGYSSYQQIPFQYSVHILESMESEPKHYDFLHITFEDPSKLFAESLQEHIGDLGSIIVWHKSFECGRNNEIAARIPSIKTYMESLNERVYDLEDIFKKQYYIHKDFRGGTSIKYILPALVSDLTYNDLEIKDGGAAADTWNKFINGIFDETERDKIISDLRAYCRLDTYALYAIWKHLTAL